MRMEGLGGMETNLGEGRIVMDMIVFHNTCSSCNTGSSSNMMGWEGVVGMRMGGIQGGRGEDSNGHDCISQHGFLPLTRDAHLCATDIPYDLD